MSIKKTILYRTPGSSEVKRKVWDGVKGHRNGSGLHPAPSNEHRKAFMEFIRREDVDYVGGGFSDK